MNNTDNPFLGLAEMVKKGGVVNGFSFCIGKVLSVFPLIVEGNNLSFSGEDLFINCDVLGGTNYAAKIDCKDVDGTTSNDERIEDLNIKNANITKLSSELTVGCNVLLLISDDRQTIVVVCKLRRG